MSTQFDPSRMNALVVDANHYQRRLTLEQLRLMGFKSARGVPDLDLAWNALYESRPEVLLIEWVEPRAPALDFIRRVRAEAEAPLSDISIFILTDRGRLVDVEDARAAGVDGYLRKPISTQAIQQRVRHSVLRPKPAPAEAEDQQAVQRARELTARLEARVQAFVDNDGQDEQPLRTAIEQLRSFASESGAEHLEFGAREMLRYLDACADGLVIDADVLRTHAAALFQISLFPKSANRARGEIAAGLTRMVDKKLRKARGL